MSISDQFFKIFKDALILNERVDRLAEYIGRVDKDMRLLVQKTSEHQRDIERRVQRIENLIEFAQRQQGDNRHLPKP